LTENEKILKKFLFSQIKQYF